MEGMNTKSIIMSVVAIAVAVLVVVTCAIPIFTSATETERTFTNEGSFDLTYSQEDDVTFFWDHTSPTTVTINDTVVNLPELVNGEQRTVLCGDSWLIRAGYGNSLGGYFIQWYPASGNNILASELNGLDFTAVCNGGTITVTDTQATPVTATSTYTYIYCISDEGNYVMKNPGESVYMNGDSEFYAMGLTNIGTYSSTGIKITGTIDDGADWSIFRGNPALFTFSNEEINYSEVAGYEDLYKLDSMTATVTVDEVDADATYSYFIVPAEVTAELTVHPTDIQITLISIIPILMVLGIIVAAVGMFLRSRAGTR